MNLTESLANYVNVVKELKEIRSVADTASNLIPIKRQNGEKEREYFN